MAYARLARCVGGLRREPGRAESRELERGGAFDAVRPRIGRGEQLPPEPRAELGLAAQRPSR